jgi:hypothetical protein
MALNRLLALISTAGAEPPLAVLSRWTETPGLDSWEPEPEYGSFVDEEGRVVTGSTPARAFLETPNPSDLELAPTTARALGNTTVVFLDWGRQPLSWEEIFEVWAAWESQDMIVDCGVVGVSWNLAGRWDSPGWIAFRGDFDGSPLSTVARKTPEAPSFLARARQLRGLEIAPPTGNDEVALPMLPFTLDDLNDPVRSWPQAVL